MYYLLFFLILFCFKIFNVENTHTNLRTQPISSTSHSASSASSSTTFTSIVRNLQAASVTVEWRAYSWDQCTVPCGGGIQRRKVLCWANVTQAETNPSFCPIVRPASAQACNTFACPTQDVTEFSCDAPFVASGGGGITSSSSSSSTSLISSSSLQETVGCTPQLRGGGRLTLQILKGNNLPNHEFYPAISRVSDPYFKVRIKGIERETKFVMNNVLNPSWTNATGEMFFGIQDSQTPIHIELWDSDGGYEGDDEKLGEIDTHVIACSAFSLLPKDVYCVEQAWLPLNKGDDCLLQSITAGKLSRNATLINPIKPCVLIRQIVETFNVTTIPPSASTSNENTGSISGEINTYAKTWGTNVSIANEYSVGLKTVGSLYVEDTLMHTDVFFEPFYKARSGLIIRSSNSSKTLGSNYSVTIKTNYRCTVFLFRYFLDGRFNTTTPQWLSSSKWVLPELGSKDAVLARPMTIDNITHVNTTFGAFRAYLRPLSAYQMITFGGPMAGFIVLDNTTVNETNARTPSDYMYFAILRQETDDEEIEVAIIPKIDRLLFLFLLPRFLILEILFLFLTLPFLKEVKFRRDLIKPYLATRVLPPTSSIILSTKEHIRKDTTSTTTKTIPNDKDVSETPNTSSSSNTISSEFIKNTTFSSRTHILASALLIHPDTLRNENERRRNFRREFRNDISTNVATTIEGVDPTKLESTMRDLETRLPTYLSVPINGSSTSFHRNLFWIQLIIESLCALPFLINISHGLVLLMLAKPPAMGLLVLFIGSAFHISLFGLGQWSSNGYRPTSSTIHSIVISVVLIFIFLYSAGLSSEAPLTLRLPVVTSISATASFLPMVLLIFLNSEEMNDSLSSISNLVRIVRAEEAEVAARAREDLKRRAEAAGLGQGTLALDIKEAKRKAQESGVDVTAALGVPSEAVQSIGNVLGSAALVCYDYALDPYMKPPDPAVMSELQYAEAKARFEAEKAAIEMKRKIAERAEKEKLKAAMRAAKRKLHAASTQKNQKLFGEDGPVVETEFERDDWDQTHKSIVQELVGRVKDESKKIAIDTKLKEEEIALERQKEYEIILAEEVTFAKEDARKRELTETGVSLGLSKKDDCVMRLAAVSSSPWLQAGLHKTKKLNHLGQRSPTLLLGVLLGSQVFSLPGAASSSELDFCDGAVGLLSSHPLIITRLSRICLLTSYIILSLHAFFTTALFPAGYSFDGFICALSFGGQDFAIYCLVSSFLYKRGPVFTCLMLAISRVCISWFAGEWWLAGQSLAFAVWGIVLGLDAGSNRLPVITQHAAEFICFMSQFSLGADFALVLKRVEIAARRYQREIASIYGINLQQDYVALDKAARAAKMAEQQRRNKIKEAGGDPDAPISEEAAEEMNKAAVKKDPYDVKDLISSQRQATDLKNQKTPFADRYKPAIVNASGGPIGKVKKDESKVVRTEAARLLALGSAAEKKIKPPPKRNRSSAKVHPAIDKNHSNKNNQEQEEEEEEDDLYAEAAVRDDQNASIPSTTKTGGYNFDVELLGAIEAPLIRKRPQEQSLFTEVIAMREAWSTLTVITCVYMCMWAPTTLYYEVSSYTAFLEPKYRAGLFDSETVFHIPKVSFFGNKVRTWVVGLACIAAVIIFVLLATAASAIELRKNGLLPTSFDIFLPYLSKYNKELRRISFPDFVFYCGVFLTIFFGLVFYWIGNSATTLIFSIFIIPLILLITSSILQFIKNGYSVLQPTRYRKKLTANDLLRLNARAGFPLALRYEYSSWVQRMTNREKEILTYLERGPTGEGRPLFEHPAAVGDGHYDPESSVDLTMLELYGPGGVGFGASSAEATVRSVAALGDSTKRKDESLSINKRSKKFTAASGEGAENDIDDENDETSGTPEERAKAKAEREQRRREALNQKVAAKTAGFVGKIVQQYYRWKLRAIDAESLGFWDALLRGNLTPTDLSIVSSILMINVLFILAALLCTAAGSSGPGPIISWGIALVPLIITFSLPPAVTYVSSSKLTFDLLMCFVTSVTLTALCLVYFISTLLTVEGYDERTAYLIGIASLYWGGLCAYIAVSSFIHHKFKFKLTSAILFCIAAFLMLCLVIIVVGWGGISFGLAFSILLLSLGWAFIALAVKARNGGHLPSCFLRFGTALMVLFCIFSLIISFFLSSNLFLLWSVAFGALVIHFGGRATTRLLLLNKESPIVFGPLIFPVLSYNIKTGQPVDESQLGADVAMTLVLFFAWGATAASFIENAFIGTSLCCIAMCITAVVFGATSSYAIVQIGKLTPYIDTDAVRGARVSVADAFFARRMLAKPEGMANTGRGTTVVDSFAAAEVKASKDVSSSEKTQQQQLNNRSLNMSRDIHTIGSSTAMNALSTKELEDIVERSLSFLDPSLRAKDAEGTNTLSHFRSLVPRETCANSLAQIACMEWCSENKWPWQVSESELNVELYTELATRFKVAAEEVIYQHNRILSQYKGFKGFLLGSGLCMNTERTLQFAARDIELMIRKYIEKAVDDFTLISDSIDVDLIRDILERHDLVAPNLTDFSISLTNAVNSKSNALETERAKKLAEARVWLEDMQARGLKRKGPAPMLGALGKSSMLGKSMRGSLMRMGSSKKKGLLAMKASVQNLNDILGTRATSLALGVDVDSGGTTSDPSSSSSRRSSSGSVSFSEDLSKSSNTLSTMRRSLSSERLPTSGDTKSLSSSSINPRSTSSPPFSSSAKFKSSVSKVVSVLALTKKNMITDGSSKDLSKLATREDSNKNLNSNITLPSSSSNKDLMAKGDLLRTLQNVSKKALIAGPSNKGMGSRSASLQNARASMKKGADDSAANIDPEEAERRKWATERQADLITKRFKSESVIETIERWFVDAYDFFFGIPLAAIPPPIPPSWHHAIERGDASATDNFTKTETKKAVVLHALTSYKNVADTGQLAAVLLHPLYAPVDRSDRPWSLGDAFFDALAVGGGPFGFVSFYGVLFRSLSLLYSILCCRLRTQKRMAQLNTENTVGCCLRRAPVHSAKTLPKETEAGRLIQRWSEHSGQTIELISADGGGSHLFPRQSKNADVSRDYHGITGASRSQFFGIATVGGGWLPDEQSIDVIRPLFEPRSQQLVQAAKNRLKTLSEQDSSSSSSSTSSSSIDQILSGNVLFAPIKSNASSSSMKLQVAVDEDGGRVLGIEPRMDIASDAADHITIFDRLMSAHLTASTEFYEEVRALLHFQMLLISYGSSRREAQIARYPAFFKEAKTKLYDAGCPKMAEDETAATSSFLSSSSPSLKTKLLVIEKVDLVHTASWLSRLPPFFQQEYATMKKVFDIGLRAYKRSQLAGYKSLMVSKIQRDEEIEIRGRMLVQASRTHAAVLEDEIRNSSSLFHNPKIASHSLTSTHNNVHNNTAVTSLSQMKEKEKTKTIVVDDTTLAHWLVNRIETRREFCSITAGGAIRPFQFVDTEFPPSSESVGTLSKKDLTSFVKPKKWQQSLALNPHSCLFRGGTDPDDVLQGVAVSDSWLLSAICMMATSGSVGDGGVDPLLARVFVVKRETRTGVYCMRIFVAGEWIPVLLDDFFPIISIPETSRNTPRVISLKPRIDQSKGAAFAHSPTFGELWVPLLEKAIAKVFGSYSELSKGYLEQALLLFTGGETQRIPIQVIADSPLRSRLWQDMLVYCNQCRYMLGAETFSSSQSRRNEDRMSDNTRSEIPKDAAFIIPGTLFRVPGVPGGALPFMEGIEPKLLLPGAVFNAPSLEPLLTLNDIERRMLCSADPKMRELKMREKKFNERYTEAEEVKIASWKTMRKIVEDFRKAEREHQVLLTSDPQASKRRVEAAISLVSDLAVKAAIDSSSYATPDGHTLLPNGLASNCVYNVDRVVEAAGRRLIRLREPPSTKSKWRGSFSELSSDWDLAVISAVRWRPDDDRREKCFWMNFDDFCANFLCLHVCRVYDEGDGWRQTTAAGAWIGPTAAGLSRQDGSVSQIHLNPQFSLDVHEPSSFCFTLRQFPQQLQHREEEEKEELKPRIGTSSSSSFPLTRSNGNKEERKVTTTKVVKKEVKEEESEEESSEEESSEESTIDDSSDMSSDDDIYADKNVGSTLSERSEKAIPRLSSNLTLDKDAQKVQSLSLFELRDKEEDAPLHPISLFIVSRAGEETLRMDLDSYSTATSDSNSNKVRASMLSKCALGRESGSSISEFDIASFPPLLSLTDGRVFGLTSSNVVATSGKPSASVSGVRLYVTLPAGRYTILCATEIEKCEGRFGLSVESTSKVKLKKIWPPEIRKKDLDELKQFEKRNANAPLKEGLRGGVGNIELVKKKKKISSYILASYANPRSWFVFPERKLIAETTSTTSLSIKTSSEKKKGAIGQATGQQLSKSTSSSSSPLPLSSSHSTIETSAEFDLDIRRGLFLFLVSFISLVGEAFGRLVVSFLRSIGFLDSHAMSDTYMTRLKEVEAFVEQSVEYNTAQEEAYDAASHFFDQNTGAPRQARDMPVFPIKAFTMRPEDEPVVAAYTSAVTSDHLDQEEENDENHQEHDGVDNPSALSSTDGDENMSEEEEEEVFEETLGEHDYTPQK